MIIVLTSMGIMKAYAAEGDSFGVRLIPEKLIENSEGTLQVYALHNDHMSPQQIQNMIYSSTDSSIVQIIGVEKSSDGFTTNLKLITSGHGSTKIELGAPGFSSKEVPITVYGNTNYPVKLLVQSTPSTFSINGPHEGYFGVELANNDGTPAITNTDIIISLTTTDNRVATLTDSQIIIKAGKYYGVGKFEVKQVGSAQIFASANSLQSASSTITVIQTGSPSIQTFIYPQKINNYAASIGYVIAQLKDSSGVLSPAKEDIIIPVSIVDPTVNQTNSSPIIQNVEAYNPIVIKKGFYWGYTNLAVRAAANGTYNVVTSAPNGYVNSGQGQITAVTTKFYDDKSARLDILPILATGNNELIGILHLEDQSGNPIIASHDLQIEIDSSDQNALTVDNVVMNKGTGVALVYGKVGTSIPSTLSLHVVTYNDQTVTPTISLPTSNSLSLVGQSMIPKILSLNNFPVAVFLKDASGAVTYFSNDSVLNVLANDYFSIPKTNIHKGDSTIVDESNSLKSGSATINFILGNYQTPVNLESSSTLPSKVVLGYSNPVLLNMENTMSVQILDSNSNPAFAQKDINLKLVSSNNQVLTLPDNVTISKGRYYTTFNVKPNSIGTTQASIIADDLPLSTYTITVDSLSPTLSIIAPTIAQPGETFVASVTAMDHGDPLKNMKIRWKVNGAIVQSGDSVTNQNGTANIVLLANSDNSITLDTNATGLGYIPGHISKIVQINGTGLDIGRVNSNSVNETNSNGTNAIKSNLSSSVGIQSILKLFKINGMDTLPIIVLGTIAAGGVLIKKNNLLLRKTHSGTKSR
jgi:hypothetical protein